MILQTREVVLWMPGSWNKCSVRLVEQNFYVRELKLKRRRTKALTLHWLPNNFYLTMNF